MLKRLFPILIVSLIAATAAHAQSGGGGGRGGRGGRTQNPAPTSTPTATSAAATPPPAPLDSIAITGVIQSIDAQHDRVTIAYDEVQALGWPHGEMPFVVGKSSLLKDATVGEKVRFRIQSQQISELTPY